MQVQLGGPVIYLLFVLSNLVKYVHYDLISYFSYLAPFALQPSFPF